MKTFSIFGSVLNELCYDVLLPITTSKPNLPQLWVPPLSPSLSLATEAEDHGNHRTQNQVLYEQLKWPFKRKKCQYLLAQNPLYLMVFIFHVCRGGDINLYFNCHLVDNTADSSVLFYDWRSPSNRSSIVSAVGFYNLKPHFPSAPPRPVSDFSICLSLHPPSSCTHPALTSLKRHYFFLSREAAVMLFLTE